MSSDITTHTAEYGQWLGELKTRFRQVQLKAAVTVNTAMLQFYWELGADMVEKQKAYAWGQGFVGQLSADLMREFPDVKGFSVRNLKNARQWYKFWLPMPIGQQAVAQFLSIPWDPPHQTTCRLPKLWISHIEATPHEKNPTHPRV